MLTAAPFAGIVCVAIWLYLLLAHGWFWRIPLPPPGVILSAAAPALGAAESKDPYGSRVRLAPSLSSSGGDGVGQCRTVAVVIPARNEAAVIDRSIGSLLRQKFPTLSPKAGEKDGAFGEQEGTPASDSIRIFIVDDHSGDGTAKVARQAALDSSAADRVTIIQGRPLPAGWSGKLWAVQQGVEQAWLLHPDFLLLTDADIEHDSHSVAQLINLAESGNYDIVSYMVKLHCRSLPEKLLIPAFVFFFFMLYPPNWIRDPRRKSAGAAGGCILIRPSALQRVGGLAAIRGEIIDDCALARAVKRTGGRVWLGATADTHSVRPYNSFAEIERMISRTAFNQLHHSFWLLLGTVMGMLLIYVLPVVLIFCGSAKLATVGAVAFALMGASYLPMVRFYGLRPLWALTLPFSAAFYTVATIHSAIKYWTGSGGEWKGRAQDR